MTHPEAADNELDIRGLCCTLWRGKYWIIGSALLFALLAYIWSLLVTPKWISTAITDQPTVNMLGNFYAQQQFLNNMDARSCNPNQVSPSVVDEAYQEFVMQLSAYDTRRAFWLQNPYYKQRQTGSASHDAALLEKLIANIQYQPGDAAKNLHDTVKLAAQTALEANTLLRQYVSFANQRAVSHLNDEVAGVWSAQTIQLKAQVKRQAEVAKAVYDRQVKSVQQALKIAQQQGFEQAKTTTTVEQLPDSELFLLGRSMLQARLESLQAAGPNVDLDYDQNNAMLNTLIVGPTRVNTFQTWRYLRTPEEPVTRDSPRRLFLMIMWGAVGAFTGAGTALVRRRRD